MSTLPASSNPKAWDDTLVGNTMFKDIPNINDSCTFNTALDTIIANPEDVCDLITREIVRNSTDMVHTFNSDTERTIIDTAMAKGLDSVKSAAAATSKPKHKPDSFFEMQSCAPVSVVETVLDGRSASASPPERDIIADVISFLPRFKSNIVETTKSLYETAAICSILGSSDDAKTSARKIVRTIKETSPVIEDIGISRVTTLVGSLSSTKQYNEFLMTVSDHRNMLIRHVSHYPYRSGVPSSSSIPTAATTVTGPNSVYEGLMTLGNESFSSKKISPSDRFWASIFEGCSNVVFNSPKESINVFGSRLNSYAAAATDAYTTNSARRSKLKVKLEDIEAFVVAASDETNSSSGISVLKKAQSLLSRLSTVIEFNRSSSGASSYVSDSKAMRIAAAAAAVHGGGDGSHPTTERTAVLSAVIQEISRHVTDQSVAKNLFFAAQILIAKAVSKVAVNATTFEDTLAAIGIGKYSYRLADTICQRMRPDDIKLFLGGPMLQRGVFSTFVLNNLLRTQISPNLKMNALAEDTKTPLVNLLEFCNATKNALATFRNKKRKIVKKYNSKPADDDLKADWAFATSVYTAYNKLKQDDDAYHISNTDQFMTEMLVAPKQRTGGGRPKRRSTLKDVVSAGSTINRSFLSNYAEKFAASKQSRLDNMNRLKTLHRRKYEDPDLLTCVRHGKFNNDPDESAWERGVWMSGTTSGFGDNDGLYEDDNIISMMLDDDDSDHMMISSSSDDDDDDEYSSSSVSSSDGDTDDDVSRRLRDLKEYDALDDLDAAAVPLGKLYACGDEGYSDDMDIDDNSTFNSRLNCIFNGGYDDDSDLSSEDDDEIIGEDEMRSRRQRKRAQRRVYGPGFLSSSLYDSFKKLSIFNTSKRARITSSSSSSSSSGSETEDASERYRTRKEQQAMVADITRRFAPKDIYIDVNGRVSNIREISSDTVGGFIENYQNSNKTDRIKMGRKSDAYEIPKKDFRRNLVKATASVLSKLKANKQTIYETLFATGNYDFEEAILKDALKGSSLEDIISKRDNLISDASKLAPSLFSCGGDKAMATLSKARDNMVPGGYLTVPLTIMGGCCTSQNDIKSITEKTHLDLLSTGGLCFARAFNLFTSHALTQLIKTDKVLRDLYVNFTKLIVSTEGSRIKTRSNLLSSIFNTRMSHTEAVLGLVLPTAFMNHELPSSSKERELVESNTLTIVRGVNSCQLSMSDIGSAASLLQHLTSRAVAGPGGMRGGLSLYRMSLTDTFSVPNSDTKRLKGAVSLEVPGELVHNAVFARKNNDLASFCQKNNITLKEAVGPIYRFSPGDIESLKSMGFNNGQVPSLSVDEDETYHKLVVRESNPGVFIKMSADGNLFGCVDTVIRLARKASEALDVIEKMADNEANKDKDHTERLEELLEKIKSKRKKIHFGDKKLVQYPNFPVLSDNILIKSKFIRSSVTTLVSDTTTRFNINSGGVSLDLFKNILESSAVLANTKITLRNIENRLEGAVSELEQFDRIREDGLGESRAVILAIVENLTVYERDTMSLLAKDAFIKFVVETELSNIKEAKRNITAALSGVQGLHIRLLNMISTSLESAEDNAALLSTVATPQISKCGRFIMHPKTKMLVKIEEEMCDVSYNFCGNRTLDVHKRIAYTMMEKIKKNKNSLLRSKLLSMRTGRYNLRDIISFNANDVAVTDHFIKTLGDAMISGSAAAVAASNSFLAGGGKSTLDSSNKEGSAVPLKKMNYIPIVIENKQNADSTVKLSSSSDASRNYLDKQEAHDLTTILNLSTKHRFGEYNQSSIVSLFNQSERAVAVLPGNDNTSSSDSAAGPVVSVQLPPSSTTEPPSPRAKLEKYISKLSSSIPSVAEYVELETIYEDAHKAVDIMRSVKDRSFLSSSGGSGEYPHQDTNTVSLISQMKATKETALTKFEKLIDMLERHKLSDDQTNQGRHNQPKIVPISDNSSAAAAAAAASVQTSADTINTGASFDKLDAILYSADVTDVTRESDAIDLLGRDAGIRVPILLAHSQFTSLLRKTFSAFSDYFKGIGTLKDHIDEDAKTMYVRQVEEIEREVENEKMNIGPALEESLDMYRQEAESIRSSMHSISNKITELENRSASQVAKLDQLASRINSGVKTISIEELWTIGHDYKYERDVVADLKEFAKDNSKEAFVPPDITGTDDRAAHLRNTAEAIRKGESMVAVSFDQAIEHFPSLEEDVGNTTLKSEEERIRKYLQAIALYLIQLKERHSLLKERLDLSALEYRGIEERKASSDVMFRHQIEEKRKMLKQCIDVAASTLHASTDADIVQAEVFVGMGSRIDKLSNASSRNSTADKNTTKEELADKIADGATFSCILKPLHDAIFKMISILKNNRKIFSGSSSNAPDLQLLSIYDLCRSVLSDDQNEKRPSGIIPGVCQLCAMMFSNMHENRHISSHSFEFDKVRSRSTLTQMLNAAIDNVDQTRARHDVMAMAESNNGYVKSLKFKKNQRVACFTPVNMLLGSFDKAVVRPGTVLLPTSELFNCEGLDHDKFRSIVNRGVNNILADASKTSESIVETMAGTSPLAEMLFFTLKDERRHFNSIPDCIIENMDSSAASSLFNTHCDQNVVSNENGVPVFVGRFGKKSGGDPAFLNTKRKAASSNGGLPTHGSRVSMSARYMVAPGSTLNAKKEELNRFSRLLDMNNVRYNDTNVHVAGSNNAWRIGEVLKAACGGNENALSRANRMVLLGSATSIATQKKSMFNNDPTALLDAMRSTSNIVRESVSSFTTGSHNIGAAETAMQTQLSYRRKLFPEISCSSELATYTMCPMDILSKYSRYQEAATHAVGCSVFARTLSSVPASRTPQGLLDASVHQNKIVFPPVKNKAQMLAAQVMADSVVDTLSAVSSAVIKPRIPSIATSGQPMDFGHASQLKNSLARVLRNAAVIDNSGLGDVSFSALGRESSSVISAILATNNMPGNSSVGSNDTTIVERVFGVILDSSSRNGGTPLQALQSTSRRRNVNAILDVNDRELAKEIDFLGETIERKQLKHALEDIRRSVFTTSSSSSEPISSLLNRNDVRSGRLSHMSLQRGKEASEAVDEFQATPLLARHMALFHPSTPVPMSMETKSLLVRTSKSIGTARQLLSEQCQFLSDAVLCNTRDTPSERAVDRILLSAYQVKHAKNFDVVDRMFPVVLTATMHNMLSSLDPSSSKLLANTALHVTDTTSAFKNAERMERFLGRYGNTYAMSHRQNCNCPFALHHDFRPSADENLIRSFAYARPEVTPEEISQTPYQCNKLLSNKHFIMASTKVDPRITGSALYKRVSEWADMRNNVNYNGVFEPSRAALTNSGFTTAGVNLDVIVRPSNAKSVLGILSCHRNHFCVPDMKCTAPVCMPSAFVPKEKGPASELLQNALAHDRYIQKSSLSAPSIIFANILETLIKNLGAEIVDRMTEHLVAEVPRSIFEDTEKLVSSLSDPSVLTFVSPMDTNDSSDFDFNKKEQKTIINTADVPFTSDANGTLSYDFLLSSDTAAATAADDKETSAGSASTSSEHTNVVSRLLEVISNRVSGNDFRNILDDIERFVQTGSSCRSTDDKDDKQTQNAVQEFKSLLSFMRILKTNVVPLLTTGELAEKMSLYISLLSAKSRLENVLKYGLSNSSSVDLSHLKPTGSYFKNIEDTFTYRQVPPILVMALPEQFSALFQQEQTDPDLIIGNRRSLATFLNHPNTSAMTRLARAAVGAGGGNALGLYPSSLILHESTITTMEPTVDTVTNVEFYAPVTNDPMMVVDPFKESSFLDTSSPVLASSTFDSSKTACKYLQVSMPTEFSGLVTNTAATSDNNGTTNTFSFVRRDGSTVTLPRITPFVLCSDASANLLDEFSRADTFMENIETKFGFMPELIVAIAKMKGMDPKDVTRQMADAVPSTASSVVDRDTGDITYTGGRFPAKAFPVNNNTTSTWGGDHGKLEARFMGNFISSNPLGAAAVNGIPITPEGEQLARIKRDRAMGINSGNNNDDRFGDGIISEGAVSALGNRLAFDLKPFKEAWDNLNKLQKTFTQTARRVREGVVSNNVKENTETAHFVELLTKDFETLKKSKNIIRDMVSRLVATSDLITGSTGGDPARALIAPFKTETMGVFGAISAGTNTGLSSLFVSYGDGTSALNDAISERATLSSGGGANMPEHSVFFRDGEALISDADSLIFQKKGTATTKNKSPIINKIIDILTKSMVSSIQPPEDYTRGEVAAPDYIVNEANKRRAVVKLLSEYPAILNSISDTLFNSDKNKNSIGADILFQTQKKQQMLSSSSINTNVSALNPLFVS